MPAVSRRCRYGFFDDHCLIEMIRVRIAVILCYFHLTYDFKEKCQSQLGRLVIVHRKYTSSELSSISANKSIVGAVATEFNVDVGAKEFNVDVGATELSVGICDMEPELLRSLVG